MLEQSSMLPVIIKQFAQIVAEAAQPVSDKHAQHLNEQAEFITALHEMIKWPICGGTFWQVEPAKKNA